MKVKIPGIIEKSKSYKNILANRKLDYELSFEKYYLILFSKQRSLGPLYIFKIYSIYSFLYINRNIMDIRQLFENCNLKCFFLSECGFANFKLNYQRMKERLLLINKKTLINI